MRILNSISITISVIFIFLSPLFSQSIDDETPEPGQKWQEPSEKTVLSKARIKFDHTTYDFGTIAKGAKVTHNYWFENSGSDTLVITRLKPTCGCTAVNKGKIILPPGERTSIDIIFDSSKFNGRVTKSIKIECNDSLNPYMDIRFKATINNPVQILEYSPLQADFQTITSDSDRKIVINLTNTDTTNSKIVIVEKPSKEFIKTKLKKDKLKPGITTEIEFTLTDVIEEGSFLASISLEFEDKPGSRITIPISGEVGK